MNPRKARELLPLIQEESGLPLNVLRDLTDCHWQELHRTLNSLQEYRVLVPCLGTFHIRGDKTLNKEIYKLHTKLKRLDQRGKKTTPVKLAIYYNQLDKLRSMERLLKQNTEEATKKVTVKQHRRDVIKSKEDLEGQDKDS